MKNKPLAVQMWILFAAVTLGITLLLLVFIPLTLRSFFTQEVYTTIESAQKVFWENRGYIDIKNSPPMTEGDHQPQRLHNRTVNHLLILKDGQILPAQVFSADFLQQINLEARNQEKMTERYSGDIGDRKMFYVIQKGEMNGEPGFLVSYMWDSYRDDLVRTLFNQLLVVMLASLMLSLIPAIWLARYLSRPMIVLEKHVKKIADKNWHEPIALDRKDEIGRLAQSIERMRERLVRQDENQQTFLQNVSHDLKTPVMVIRSYAQSIQDGIYPKGDLPNTVKVIEDEAETLDKRIRDLLFLTKLDYLSTREFEKVTIHMKELIESSVERLRWSRPELQWSLHLENLQIRGDLHQWKEAINNLLDNQLRYASNQVMISLYTDAKGESEKDIVVRIWNDGPSIEPDMMEHLFQKFHKGVKGEFGLGLAIFQRIVNLHQGKVEVKNEQGGVAFYIRIPDGS